MESTLMSQWFIERRAMCRKIARSVDGRDGLHLEPTPTSAI